MHIHICIMAVGPKFLNNKIWTPRGFKAWVSRASTRLQDRVAFGLLNSCQEEYRGPIYFTNIRTLHSGFKAQDKGDARNHGL